MGMTPGKGIGIGFQLVDSGWGRVLEEAVAASGSELRIVCPFIKERAALRLLAGGKPETIQVITRFNLGDFGEGVSDTAALRLLLDHGAQIRGIRGLHAKLYLIGGRALVAPGGLAEDLTKARIDSWDEKVADALAFRHRPAGAIGLGDEGVKVSMPKEAGGGAKTGASPSLHDEPVRWTEASQAFVKFFGESTNRSGRDRLILDEVDGSGCHWACTYPKGRRPRQVQDGAVMFIGKLVTDPNDTLIYGRAVGLRYQEGRDDATPEDIKSRHWKEKWPHYVRVHHAEFVAGTLSNGVSLSALMAELKSDSFRTTQEHAAAGSDKTNPRRAYLQQPAVQLSDEGYAWLNARLAEAFETHGMLTPEELGRLDWPKSPE